MKGLKTINFVIFFGIMFLGILKAAKVSTHVDLQAIIHHTNERYLSTTLSPIRFEAGNLGLR